MYELPKLQDIKAYKDEQIEALWDEYKTYLEPRAISSRSLSKDIDQKLASIAEIREEVRLKAEQLAKKTQSKGNVMRPLQQKIIERFV